MLCFTAEEAWLQRYGDDAPSVHLQIFPKVPAEWRNDALAEKWRKIRNVRRVVTGALELERAQKRIGSSLEAAPVIHVSDPDLFAAIVDADLAEICITSAATLAEGEGPADAFRLDDVRGVAVVPVARAWKKMRALVENLRKRRRRSDVSRRYAARRAGFARMGRAAQGGGIAKFSGSSPRTDARNAA